MSICLCESGALYFKHEWHSSADVRCFCVPGVRKKFKLTETIRTFQHSAQFLYSIDSSIGGFIISTWSRGAVHPTILPWTWTLWPLTEPYRWIHYICVMNQNCWGQLLGLAPRLHVDIMNPPILLLLTSFGKLKRNEDKMDSYLLRFSRLCDSRLFSHAVELLLRAAGTRPSLLLSLISFTFGTVLPLYLNWTDGRPLSPNSTYV